MPLTPLNDKVLIRRLIEEEKTKGGIIIPENAKEKPQQGDVVAVGPGKRDDKGARQALGVTPGDRVLFGKYAGSEIKLDGAEFVIMSESDILGIVGVSA